MKRLVHSTGEPAGIGPELLIRLAQEPVAAQRIVCGDPQLLHAVAKRLQLPLQLNHVSDVPAAANWQAGDLLCIPHELPARPQDGEPDPANAAAVLETLDAAVAMMDDAHSALVTGPLHKAAINAAGIPFSGHTEYLAKLAGRNRVVMMLADGPLRVALLTTHLPLAAVPAAITTTGILECLRIIRTDLIARFGCDEPRIAVCGLNPHAGEGGHLGREEIDIIEPALIQARAEGLTVSGPLPADTAFTPAQLSNCDVVLAMFHDQGLPVIKHAGFATAVNVTLGLPYVRTSVDHGTAFDLMYTGKADISSLRAAEQMALRMLGA